MSSIQLMLFFYIRSSIIFIFQRLSQYIQYKGSQYKGSIFFLLAQNQENVDNNIAENDILHANNNNTNNKSNRIDIGHSVIIK